MNYEFKRKPVEKMNTSR